MYASGVGVGRERMQVDKLETEVEGGDNGKDDVEEDTFEEAVKKRTVMRGIVEKWLNDKGYRFMKVLGKQVVCHADRVVGQGWLKEI